MAVNVTLVLGYCVVQNATLRFWKMAVNVTPVLLCGSECYFPFLDDSNSRFCLDPHGS